MALAIRSCFQVNFSSGLRIKIEFLYSHCNGLRGSCERKMLYFQFLIKGTTSMLLLWLSVYVLCFVSVSVIMSLCLNRSSISSWICFGLVLIWFLHTETILPVLGRLGTFSGCSGGSGFKIS